MFRPNPLTIKANAELVLEVIDLSVRYQTRQGEVQAVEGVSFELGQGQSLGLVGESGCGKTSVANSLMGLLPENARLAGGQAGDAHGGSGQPVDAAAIRWGQLRAFRRQAQMIFQDPYESMNPRRTIYDTIAEPLAVQGIGSLMDRVDRVTEILTQVGLTPASSFLFRHPHELSGGQRQRVAIARALVIGPSFVVADEPTSMLDVSSRTGIMLLMQELAARLGIAYLYITHDLAVARYMCHRIAVMYLGKIIELAETEELLRNPLHPYTRALLSAVPVPDPTYRRDRPDIRGDLTLPIDPPARCRFYDRCPIGTDFCRDNPHPPMEERAAGHWVACYEA
ncbi:Oligopeptide transport ATP-binding protein AppF [Geodia barretti]|uniref:Oligopeptide transport ATP-binding protein AppF n=1 Tax=Geodia barretti TaxID=519541 RepID=A0AA35WXE3_GEOBA|nr:Oligopeptide transport ATP-binding protein AppF [Geodia barretti]